MPNWVQMILTFAGVIVGSGLIQFFITRKDSKKNEITELKKDLKEGLEARERTGKERYLEHQEAIQKLNEAIFQLTKNDTEQSQYMKNIGESLIGLSHDKIISLSDKYMERGAITLKEKGTIRSIYEPYQKLGGNGDCHVAYGYINNLPVVSEEKARELDKELAAQ